MFLNLNPFFSHPLDQFEIFYLFSYWSGINMPVGSSVITNLTVILLLNVLLIRFMFSAVFDRGNFNVWEFLMREIYDLVKSIVKSNTSLKKKSIFFDSFLFIYFYFSFKFSRVSSLFFYSNEFFCNYLFFSIILFYWNKYYRDISTPMTYC